MMKIFCKLLGHKWPEQSCICARCDTQKEHAWKPVTGSRYDECRQCRTCGIFRYHEWTSWEPQGKNAACPVLLRKCLVCGTQQNKTEHSFTEWKESKTERHRSCTKCRRTEREVFGNCLTCDGTGVCPSCKGNCSDAYGVSCNYCCGHGDCRMCNGERGNWYAEPERKPPDL